MYARFCLLFLLACAAQQGLAASVPSSNDIGYSYNTFDVVEVATDTVPQLGFASGLTRGIENCKNQLQGVGSGITGFFRNSYGFIDDAVRAYKEYTLCDSAIGENAITICRNDVRKEYLDSVRLRAHFVYEALKLAVVSFVKLPVCIFVKP